MKTIYKDNGFKGFYAGATYPLVGSIIFRGL